MGLSDKSHEKRTFLNIVSGSFAKRVDKDYVGAQKREIEGDNGEKKTIYETRHSTLSARINGVEIKEGGKFGDQLLVHLQDGPDSFTLSLSLQSREAKSFMTCLPNIDMSKEIVLEPYNYMSKKDNKKKIGMAICQGAKGSDGRYPKVPYFYNKDNGLPAVSEKVDMDEFKLAMQQQTIFLKKKTKEFISKIEENKSTHLTANLQSKSGDDLPF